MTIIRPRLNDYHGLPFTQAEVDFAIPYLDEDIPLFLDPFLLWRSPSLQDKALHTAITNSFNHLGYLVNNGQRDQAAGILIRLSECNAVGLGDSKNRIGKPIGRMIADDVLSLFTGIPQVQASGFVHIEEIQLLVDNVAKDRVSDIACNFITSWLIDYTIQQCNLLRIPRDVLIQSELDTPRGAQASSSGAATAALTAATNDGPVAVFSSTLPLSLSPFWLLCC